MEESGSEKQDESAIPQKDQVFVGFDKDRPLSLDKENSSFIAEPQVKNKDQRFKEPEPQKAPITYSKRNPVSRPAPNIGSIQPKR